MDYKNGKIYVIRNKVNDLVYVGSTTQTLSKRITEHRSRARTGNKKYKLYEEMRSLGIDNFYIELLENYPCKSKEELNTREGHYIRQFNSFKDGYNVTVAGRSKQEYRKDNIDNLKQYYNEWKVKNKDNLDNYKKQYYQENKDKIQEYRQTDKFKQIKNDSDKKYYEANKEKIKEYKRLWHLKRKTNLT